MFIYPLLKAIITCRTHWTLHIGCVLTLRRRTRQSLHIFPFEWPYCSNNCHFVVNSYTYTLNHPCGFVFYNFSDPGRFIRTIVETLASLSRKRALRFAIEMATNSNFISDSSIWGGIPAMGPPPGVIANFENPDSCGAAIIILGSVLAPIMFLFVSIRIYTRSHISRKFRWDDGSPYYRFFFFLFSG